MTSPRCCARGERSPLVAALELMALELYRRGVVSGGKATEWLGTSKQEFTQHASRLGILAVQMSGDEWEMEAKLAAVCVAGMM
jgi:hypothetical protein